MHKQASEPCLGFKQGASINKSEYDSLKQFISAVLKQTCTAATLNSKTFLTAML
jgi:hypothetical protein